MKNNGTFCKLSECTQHVMQASKQHYKTHHVELAPWNWKLKLAWLCMKN